MLSEGRTYETGLVDAQQECEGIQKKNKDVYLTNSR
jgi:hypothetical protein